MFVQWTPHVYTVGMVDLFGHAFDSSIEDHSSFPYNKLVKEQILGYNGYIVSSTKLVEEKINGYLY